MNNIRNIAILLLLVFAGFYSCKEGDRFEISSDDKIPPSAPVFDSVQALPGGARLFYKIPADEDLISIEASFTAANGKLVKSAVSFYAKSLDVFGFADTLEHTLQLYALDKAGNKSATVDVHVTPLKPAFIKVAESLTIKPSFTALMVSWENELQQSINIYVDFSYSLNGTTRSVRQAISSKKLTDRQFIKDLDIPGTEPVRVHFSVADIYGNESESYDLGELHVMRDEMLDKSKMRLPEIGAEIGKEESGSPVYMSNGNLSMGNTACLIDGILEYTGTSFTINVADFQGNWNMTKVVNGVTRTVDVNANPCWNVILDLGDYYEISRIITHQKWTYGHLNQMVLNNVGWLYTYGNVGIYRVYWLDEATGVWKRINETKIPMPPSDYSNMEILLEAVKGNEAFMYPDDPDFTPRTRYFRYEGVKGFGTNYTYAAGQLTEMTLYGRKAR
jgi:hypothetical protein